MYILIAESGATKCQWILLNKKTQTIDFEFFTKGFSPFFYTSAQIVAELKNNPDLKKIASEQGIEKMFFFGAGCSSLERCEIIQSAMHQLFTNIKNNCLHIYHDLQAAAIALCGNRAGIACILGTGSNSCFFDGKNVIEVIPSIDYILGDEGSGAFLGKKLLADFLYKKIPQDLSKNLAQSYTLSKDYILQKIATNGGEAKRFLASFAPFLALHQQNEYVKALLYNSFETFIKIHVHCYQQWEQYPVHFTGSVAWYFQATLKQVAAANGLQVGKIVQQPIYELVNFYKHEE